MKRYTVQEYAQLVGKTPVAIYKGKRYKRFITVLNGVKYVDIPSNIDPLTLQEVNASANTVDNGLLTVTNTVNNPVKAASSPADGRDFAQEIDALTAEKNLLQTQLDGLKGILAEKDEVINALQQRIDALERDKVYLQGQYQQQAELLNRLTLPAPKKSLGERVKAALGIKPKTI